MVDDLMRYTAIVLEDVEVSCVGCLGDLFGDGLVGGYS